MKYAFAAAAIIGAVAAAPGGWEKPEGYGAPAYQPETTSCSEESSSWAAPTPAPYTKPAEQTWASESSTWSAESSSTWAAASPSTWAAESSSTWVESSSAPTPAPYKPTWTSSEAKPTWATSESASSTWVESKSSTWVESSSSTWVESSSVWTSESKPTPAPYKPTTWAETSSKAVGTAPGPVSPVKTAPAGAAAPSGYKPAASGYKPSGTGVASAASPTGSPIQPYKGAANAVNAAGFLAGVGAIAALFL